jgi:hypothetical protein
MSEELKKHIEKVGRKIVNCLEKQLKETNNGTQKKGKPNTHMSKDRPCY